MLRFFKYFILVLSFCSASAFAGIGWTVKFENMSHKIITIKSTYENCFYLNDFAQEVQIPPRSSLTVYAEEKNKGTCNGTFYRIHQLNLEASVRSLASEKEEFSFPLSFIGDFSNPPAFPPSLKLKAGSHEMIRKFAYGDITGYHHQVSASNSSANAYIYIDENGMPEAVFLTAWWF